MFMKNNLPLWFRIIFYLTFVLLFAFIGWTMTAGDVGLDVWLWLILFIIIASPKLLISLNCIIAIWIIYAVKKRSAFEVSRPLAVIYIALALTSVILPVKEFAPYIQSDIERSQRKKAEYKANHATDKEVLSFLRESEGEEFEIVRGNGSSYVYCRPAAHPEVVFGVEKRNGELTYKDSYKKAVVGRNIQQKAIAELNVLDVDCYCSPDLTYSWDDIASLDESLYYTENMLDSLYIESYRILVFVELQDSYDSQRLYDSVCGMTDIVDGEYLTVELVPVTPEALEKYRQSDSEGPLGYYSHYTTTINRVELHFENGATEMDIDEFDQRLDEVIEARKEECASYAYN